MKATKNNPTKNDYSTKSLNTALGEIATELREGKRCPDCGNTHGYETGVACPRCNRVSEAPAL